MRGYKKRINTIKAILAGSIISSAPNYNSIDLEFSEINNCKKIIKNNRKFILMVLHSTRALDSSMNFFVNHHGVATFPPRGGRGRPRTARSLGQYIDALELHTNSRLGKLTNVEATGFKSRIANVRNNYMHAAGTFPANAIEIYTLLSEMELLIVRMTNL
jgi:hypothetical protein